MDQINILELCLQFLNDPKELFDCRTVCKFWYDVIEYLIKNMNSIECRLLFYHRKIKQLDQRSDWLPGWCENGKSRAAHVWRDYGVYFQICVYDGFYWLRLCDFLGTTFRQKVCEEVDLSYIRIFTFQYPCVNALIAVTCSDDQIKWFRFSFDDMNIVSVNQVNESAFLRQNYEYDYLLRGSQLTEDTNVFRCENDEEVQIILKRLNFIVKSEYYVRFANLKDHLILIHYLENDLVFFQHQTMGIFFSDNLRKAFKIQFPSDHSKYFYLVSYCHYRKSFVLIRLLKDINNPIPNFFQLYKVLPQNLINLNSQ